MTDDATPVEKVYQPVTREGPGRQPIERPVVAFDDDHARFLTTAYKALGEPEAIRCYLNDLELGIQPCDPDHAHAYPVHPLKAGARFSCGWLKHELDLDTELRGRVELEYDEELDLWIADVDKALGPNADVSVDNALSALRLAGEYLEDREQHDLANRVGRVYRDLRDRRDELRRDDRMVSRS